MPKEAKTVSRPGAVGASGRLSSDNGMTKRRKGRHQPAGKSRLCFFDSRAKWRARNLPDGAERNTTSACATLSAVLSIDIALFLCRIRLCWHGAYMLGQQARWIQYWVACRIVQSMRAGYFANSMAIVLERCFLLRCSNATLSIAFFLLRRATRP
jgi:hypothetical protein